MGRFLDVVWPDGPFLDVVWYDLSITKTFSAPCEFIIFLDICGGFPSYPTHQIRNHSQPYFPGAEVAHQLTRYTIKGFNHISI